MKDRKWWKNEKCGVFCIQFVSVLTGLGPNWMISHFSIKKKKKKRKETNCMASLEWLWFWSCLWGGRIWAVYKVMTLLVADMKRFSVRLTLSPLKSTCYIQMLLRFPPLCLRAAAYLSDRGRCCGFQSGGGWKLLWFGGSLSSDHHRFALRPRAGQPVALKALSVIRPDRLMSRWRVPTNLDPSQTSAVSFGSRFW